MSPLNFLLILFLLQSLSIGHGVAGLIDHFDLIEVPERVDLGRSTEIRLEAKDAFGRPVLLSSTPGQPRFFFEKAPGPLLLTELGGDKVEVMNVTATPIDLTGWSLQFQSIGNAVDSSFPTNREVELARGTLAEPGIPFVVVTPSVVSLATAPLILLNPDGVVVDALANDLQSSHPIDTRPPLVPEHWNWIEYSSGNGLADRPGPGERTGKVDHDTILDWRTGRSSMGKLNANLATMFSPRPVPLTAEIQNSTVSASVWTLKLRLLTAQPLTRISVLIDSGVVPVNGVLNVVPTDRATLHLPSAFREGTVAVGVLSSLNPSTSERVFSLTLSPGSSNRVSTSATVVLPLNATQTSFELRSLDNTRLEGTIPVMVTATELDGTSLQANGFVLDDEVANMRLNVEVAQNGDLRIPSGRAEIRLSRHADADIAIRLASSHPQILGVPRSILIPAGFDRAYFGVTQLPSGQNETYRGVRIDAIEPSFGTASTEVDVTTGPPAAAVPSPVMNRSSDLGKLGLSVTSLPPFLEESLTNPSAQSAENGLVSENLLPPPLATLSSGILYTNVRWGAFDTKRLRVYSPLSPAPGVQVLNLTDGTSSVIGVASVVGGTELEVNGDLVYFIAPPRSVLRYDPTFNQLLPPITLPAGTEITAAASWPGQSNVLAVTVLKTSGPSLAIFSNAVSTVNPGVVGLVPVSALSFSPDGGTLYISGEASDPPALITATRRASSVTFGSIEFDPQTRPYAQPILAAGNRLFSPLGWSTPLTNAANSTVSLEHFPVAWRFSTQAMAVSPDLEEVYYLGSLGGAQRELSLLVFNARSARLVRFAKLPADLPGRPVALSVSRSSGLLIGFDTAFSAEAASGSSPTLCWMPQDPSRSFDPGAVEFKLEPSVSSADGINEPATLDRPIVGTVRIQNLGEAPFRVVRCHLSTTANLEIEYAGFVLDSSAIMDSNHDIVRDHLWGGTQDILSLTLKGKQAGPSQILLSIEGEDLAGHLTSLQLPLDFEVLPPRVADVALIQSKFLPQGPFTPGDRIRASFTLTNRGISASRAFYLSGTTFGYQDGEGEPHWSIEGPNGAVPVENPGSLFLRFQSLKPGESFKIDAEFTAIRPGLYSGATMQLLGEVNDPLWLVNPLDPNLENNRSLFPISVLNTNQSTPFQSFALPASGDGGVLSRSGRKLLLKAGPESGDLNGSILEYSLADGTFKVLVPSSVKLDAFTLDSNGETLHGLSAQRSRLVGISLSTGAILYEVAVPFPMEVGSPLYAHPERSGEFVVITTPFNALSTIGWFKNGILQHSLNSADRVLGRVRFAPDKDRIYLSRRTEVWFCDLTPEGIVESPLRLSANSFDDSWQPLPGDRVIFSDGRILNANTGELAERLRWSGSPLVDPDGNRLYLVEPPGAQAAEIPSPQLRIHVLDSVNLDYLGAHFLPSSTPIWGQLGLLRDHSLVALASGEGVTLVNSLLSDLPSESDLSLTRESSPTRFEQGQLVTNRWTLRCEGPKAADHVLYKLQLADGLELVSVQWNALGDPQTTNSAEVRVGLIYPGDSLDLSTVIRARTNGNLRIEAVVSSSLPDPKPDSNRAGFDVEIPEPPYLMIDSGMATESSTGFQVWVRLSRPTSLPVSLKVMAVSGSAIVGQDVIFPASTLVFRPPTIAMPVTLQASRDALVEEDEIFYLVATNVVNAIPLQASVPWIIQDRKPFLTVTAIPGAEALLATDSCAFQCALDAPYAKDVFIEVRTLGGSATPGIDYLPQHQLALLPAGSTNLTIRVPVLNDDVEEPDETLTLDLLSIRGAATFSNGATAQILDDDGDHSISITSVEFTPAFIVVTFTSTPGYDYDVERSPVAVGARWKGSSSLTRATAGSTKKSISRSFGLPREEYLRVKRATGSPIP